MSHADLLASYASRRDAAAFAQIVTDYQRLVLGTCRRTLHHPSDLDDAVQETFLRLSQKARELRTNLGAWLHKCAVNVAIDINRRRSARARHEAAAAKVPAAGDEPSRTLAELREHLDAALAKLDDEPRELIIQRYFVGRAQIELAAEAGVAPSTLANRLEKAIDTLRHHLKAMGCGAVAAGGATGMAGLLRTENASAAVPQELTANLMKIGLSGVPGLAGASMSVWVIKMLGAIAAVLVLAGGIWVGVRHRSGVVAQTRPAMPSAPAITTGADGGTASAQPPKWQTTQASAQPAVLAGRVLDGDGKPVPNATVSLNGPGYAQVKTDAQGNYAFNSIKNSGEYRIGVEAEGFVPLAPYVSRDPALQLTPQSQARRELVISRGVSLLVWVTNALGEPVPKAGIDADLRGDERHRSTVGRMQTNETGLAKLVLPVSSSPYVVAATLDGNAPAHALVTPKSVDKPLELKLTLAPGLSVKGVAICSDGKPATGWEIVAKPEWWSSNYYPRGAPIGKDGSFTLNDIVPGQYTLDLSIRKGGGGMSFQIAALKLPAATQPLRLDVPRPSPGAQVKFAGRVRIIGGQPDYLRVQAMGGSVETGPDWHDTQVEFGRTVRSSTQPATVEGRFSFDGIPKGTYRLSFESPQIEPKVVEKVEVPGELPVIELKLVGKPHLGGTVVDGATGKPIPHFAVRARKLETIGNGPNYVQDARWIQVSNPQGRFDIDLVGMGVYQVQASIEGYAWIWSAKTRVEGGAAPSLVLKATPGGALNGRLVDPVGKPVAGAKVVPLSMAKSTSMGHGNDRFEGDAGAVMSDASGQFTLPHLAAGEETIKVTHRDFAPLIVPKLKIAKGSMADAGTGILHGGGAVEGVVYDTQGKPVAGVPLQFQDDFGYGGGGDEEAGRLASISTDENGHFRIEHLPEQVIYVNRPEMWKVQGVVRRTIHPVNGKTARLDFGGANPVKGRLVKDGHPRSNAPVELSVRSQYLGPVMVKGSTDADGRFIFYGPPAGRYTLYSQAPRQRGEWIAIRDVDVADQPLDLGDITPDLGDVLVNITADDPADVKAITYVSVSTDKRGQFWGESVARASADGAVSGKWMAKDVPVGHFKAQASLGGDSHLSLAAPFDRAAGQAQTQVNLHVPRSSATLTVSIGQSGSEDSNVMPGVAIATEDQHVSTWAKVDPSKPTTLKLPAGVYRIFDVPRFRPRPDIEPIILKDGQSRSVQVALEPPGSAAANIVQLCAWSADGVLIPGATVQLIDSAGKRLEAGGDTGIGTLFAAAPGHYKALLDQPARPAVVREIDVLAPGVNPMQSRWNSIDLFMP